MLAKRTSNNLVALPREIVAEFQGTEYFRVTVEDGRVVLTPTDLTHEEVKQVTSAVRQERLAKIGMTQADVDRIVAEAQRE